jgi:hypothetical protein
MGSPVATGFGTLRQDLQFVDTNGDGKADLTTTSGSVRSEEVCESGQNGWCRGQSPVPRTRYRVLSPITGQLYLWFLVHGL